VLFKVSLLKAAQFFVGGHCRRDGGKHESIALSSSDKFAFTQRVPWQHTIPCGQRVLQLF
jgi:hypothetical protein